VGGWLEWLRVINRDQSASEHQVTAWLSWS